MKTTCLYPAVPSENNHKFGRAFAVGAMAVSLLLGASAAQAATVILDGSNVVGIDSLDVTDQYGTVTTYDVEFLDTTAAVLYGVGLEPQLRDEDSMLGKIAVEDALNANIPLPTGAGPTGSDQFFIGSYDPTEPGFVVVGSEFFSGAGADEWNWCKTDCLPLGIKIVEPDETYTYASFTESGGPPVPLPPAVWLFGSALMGLVGVARRKKAS